MALLLDFTVTVNFILKIVNYWEEDRMNKQVTYRPFKREDLPALVQVIIDSWNYDKQFDPKTAKHFAHVFLCYELARATYSRVALLNGEAVGILLAERCGMLAA
jgi:FMN-dependent NADH-azoreductase